MKSAATQWKLKALAAAISMVVPALALELRQLTVRVRGSLLALADFAGTATIG
jgi:hypothetical protein